MGKGNYAKLNVAFTVASVKSDRGMDESMVVDSSLDIAIIQKAENQARPEKL